MPTYYVTFGQKFRREPHPVLGSRPDLPDGWLEVTTGSLADATATVTRLIGREYSRIYTTRPSESWYPLGSRGRLVDAAKPRRNR